MIFNDGGTVRAFKVTYPENIDADISGPAPARELKNVVIDGDRFTSDTIKGTIVTALLPNGTDTPTRRQGIVLAMAPFPEEVLYIRSQTSAFASSFLEEKGRPVSSYWAENAVDSNPATAWVEGAKDTGVGEWLRLTFAAPQTITGIRLINGYAKSKSTFSRNARIKKLRLTTSAGDAMLLPLEDHSQEQSFPVRFVQPIVWIQAEIADVYPGTKFADTCLSEFAVDTGEP